jgi:hypothetical protein
MQKLGLRPLISSLPSYVDPGVLNGRNSLTGPWRSWMKSYGNTTCPPIDPPDNAANGPSRRRVTRGYYFMQQWDLKMKTISRRAFSTGIALLPFARFTAAFAEFDLTRHCSAVQSPWTADESLA